MMERAKYQKGKKNFLSFINIMYFFIFIAYHIEKLYTLSEHTHTKEGFSFNKNFSSRARIFFIHKFSSSRHQVTMRLHTKHQHYRAREREWEMGFARWKYFKTKKKWKEENKSVRWNWIFALLILKFSYFIIYKFLKREKEKKKRKILHYHCWKSNDNFFFAVWKDGRKIEMNEI